MAAMVVTKVQPGVQVEVRYHFVDCLPPERELAWQRFWKGFIGRYLEEKKET